MNNRKQIIEAVECCKLGCKLAASEFISTTRNSFTMRSEIIEKGNVMYLQIRHEFAQLLQKVLDAQSEPSRFNHVVASEPNHIDHLVDMWIANPTMTTGEVRDLYSDLIDEAESLAPIRKDGEDSCQC